MAPLSPNTSTKHLGQDVAVDRSVRDEVADLVLDAPRAPEQSFPGGATELEIEDLQGRLGFPLPPALVDWLRVCKGEAIGPGGVLGARPDRPSLDIATTMDEFVAWRLNRWIPIAGDGCGDHYVLIDDGKLAKCVGYVDQENFDVIRYVVASDLWLFLRFLLRSDAGDRSWPFDRNEVLSADPGMGAVPSELLPW